MVLKISETRAKEFKEGECSRDSGFPGSELSRARESHSPEVQAKCSDSASMLVHYSISVHAPGDLRALLFLALRV